MMPTDSSVPRRVTLADLLDLKVVSDPQLSPDGNWLAWVVAESNKTETPKPRSRIWAMTPLNGRHGRSSNGGLDGLNRSAGETAEPASDVHRINPAGLPGTGKLFLRSPTPPVAMLYPPCSVLNIRR